MTLRLFTRLTMILASLATIGLMLTATAAIFVMNSEVFHGTGFPVDFAAFWGAARLGLEGQAVQAFDWPAMKAVIDVPPDQDQSSFPWLYPPTWHLLVLPLGLLPFSVAWWLFSFLAIAVFLVAIRHWVVALPGGHNLALAAPVTLLGALNGNNGLLTAGILVAALSALAAGRQARSGLLIALLAVKPTLGLLLPFALAGAGLWRAFLWAAAGTAGFLALATAAFGLDYWRAFLDVVAGIPERMATGDIPLQVTVTWYGFVRAIGLGHAEGLWLQGAVVLALLALVVMVWRGPAPLALKGAVLLVAVPLATPYAHYYEMAFTLAGAIFFVAAGGGRRLPEQVLIGLLWALPLLVLVRDPPTLALAAAPLATLFIAVMLAHLRRAAP